MATKMKTVLKKITLGLLTSLAVSSTPALADKLELSDYMHWENVSNPQISPNGSSIIYSRSRADIMLDEWVPDFGC